MRYDIRVHKATFEIHKLKIYNKYAVKLFLFPLNLQMICLATDQIQQWPQQQLLDFPFILSDQEVWGFCYGCVILNRV